MADTLGLFKKDEMSKMNKNKSFSHYGVHGIQINRLGLTVSTQKSDLKNKHSKNRHSLTN